MKRSLEWPVAPVKRILPAARNTAVTNDCRYRTFVTAAGIARGVLRRLWLPLASRDSLAARRGTDHLTRGLRRRRLARLRPRRGGHRWRAGRRHARAVHDTGTTPRQHARGGHGGCRDTLVTWPAWLTAHD